MASNVFYCLYQLTNFKHDNMKFQTFTKRLLEHSDMVEGFKKLLNAENIV